MSRNRLMKLEDFIFNLQEFKFSFLSDDLQEFIQQNCLEADIHSIAYQGGDAYMMAYMNAVKSAIQDKVRMEAEAVNRRTPEEYAAIKLFETLDSELKEYIVSLNSHDWYYSYSDDVKVWRSGNDNFNRLKQIADTKGGEFQKMFDKFQSIK